MEFSAMLRELISFITLPNKPDIDAIREEIKEETNPEAKKELQGELFSTMRELVDELHDVGK